MGAVRRPRQHLREDGEYLPHGVSGFRDALRPGQSAAVPVQQWGRVHVGDCGQGGGDGEEDGEAAEDCGAQEQPVPAAAPNVRMWVWVGDRGMRVMPARICLSR